MPKNQRRKAATAAAVTAGLYLAVTPPSLAFHLHALRGVRINSSGGSSTKYHTLRGRRSAATWRKLTMDAGGQGDNEVVSGRHDAGVTLYSAASRHSVGRTSEKDGGGAGKDVAALVLSALLLVNPRLADASAASGVVTQQERLLTDLEQRLMKLPSGPRQTAETSSAPEEVVTGSEIETRSRATREVTTEPTAQPKSPTSPASDVDVPLSASDVSKTTLHTTAAPPAPTTTAASPDAKIEPTPAPKVGSLVGEEQESLVRMQEYTFSVKVPELNVKFAPVAPITVPAEGSLFGGLSLERVGPPPNLPPPAGAVRDALEMARKGEGLQELMRSIGNFVPKQADYYRTVAELEDRVHSSVKAVDNPLFAPGVPLSPEFTSMFSRAKETAFGVMRPYLAKGVEPELALFMLATLPVVTVVLRAADEQSRRPMEAPRPPDYRPPRVVRYPNSPAKADKRLLAEDRAQDGTAAVAAPVSPAVDGMTGGAAAAMAGVGAVNLVGNVKAAAAVEDGEERLRAELKRLQGELASATMLAGKVEALERANARLMKQVAELGRPPSPEEIQRLAEKEAERARQQKEREKRQSKASRSVRKRTAQVIAAREALAESFSMRGSGTTFVEESEVEEEEEKAFMPPPLPVVLGNSAPSTVADEGKGSVALAGSSAAATVVTTPAAASTSPLPAVSTEEAEVSFGAPSVHNGLGSQEQAGQKLGDEDMAAPAVPAAVASTVGEAASPARVPDDFEGASDALSRALRGVQGFDLDALDLEMDDLRPEDLEELRKLEREMGDLDMASLEEEFDKEDDETITNALRIAAESAMAHTSGDGRRIRTASPVGATSSRSASNRGSGSGAEIGAVDSPASQAAAPVRGVGTAVYDAPLGEGSAGEWLPSPVVAEDTAAMKKLAQEEGVGGKWEGWEEWCSLSASEVKRKTVAQLKGFLDEEGVGYPSKARKADLVSLVCESIAC